MDWKLFSSECIMKRTEFAYEMTRYIPIVPKQMSSDKSSEGYRNRRMLQIFRKISDQTRLSISSVQARSSSPWSLFLFSSKVSFSLATFWANLRHSSLYREFISLTWDVWNELTLCATTRSQFSLIPFRIVAAAPRPGTPTMSETIPIVPKIGSKRAVMVTGQYFQLNYSTR